MGHLLGMGTYTLVRLRFILSSSAFSITLWVCTQFYHSGLHHCGVLSLIPLSLAPFHLSRVIPRPVRFCGDRDSNCSCTVSAEVNPYYSSPILHHFSMHSSCPLDSDQSFDRASRAPSNHLFPCAPGRSRVSVGESDRNVPRFD